jgi:hypothetical protein
MKLRGREAATAAVTVLVLMGVAAVILGLLGDEPGDGTADCGPLPSPALAPSGGGPAAYTMGLRVNQVADVDEFAESGLRDRIADRDVFIVNTEYAGSGPEQWRSVVDDLTERFPCNRVATLNGLGGDEGKPGYMLALADEPRVAAILLDWEQVTYESAGGEWTPGLRQNLKRISQRLGKLAEELSGSETRMGLVPDYLPPWDYGSTAKVVAQANWALDPTHLGYQLVQTQTNCGDPAAPGPLIGEVAADLVAQYKPLFGLEPGPNGWRPADEPSEVLLQHLGFEISFDTTPNPRSREPVERIGPAQAARCTQEVLKEGGTAILYWAAPSAVKAMLDTPIGRGLRPGSG